MSPRVTCRFRVRHYELDVLGHVNNVVYAQYMQEAAIEASAQAGYGLDWYRERGSAWVIRRLTVRYLAPVTYGDEVAVTTWISRMRGVSSNREYDLTRTSDGARVARARAQWVYVDLQNGQPQRFPVDFGEAFARGAEEENLNVRLQKATPTAGAHRYRSRRRVHFHELDPAQHVNHAVYLKWIVQAYCDAVRAAGYPLERSRQEGWLALQGGHDIEYHAPARDNDEIEIVSWICEIGKVRGAWTHEIYNAATGKLLARDYSLGVFVTLEGRPTTLRREVIESVLHGPAPA